MVTNLRLLSVCHRLSQPAIIRGAPPHWVNEPHQELAPALMVVAGRWLLPSSTPPRAPPSHVVVVDLLPLQGVWWILLEKIDDPQVLDDPKGISIGSMNVDNPNVYNDKSGLLLI